MMNLKNVVKVNRSVFFIASLIGMFAISSCSTDDEINDDPVLQLDPPIVLDCDYFNEDRILTNNPNAAVDYVITCIMLVKGNIKVEPGVVIEFEQEAGINVFQDGAVANVSFSAVGTLNNPIVFRGKSNEKGFWTGIRFRAAASVKNELKHVVLKDAGHPWWGVDNSGGVIVEAWSPKLKITNSTISNCKNFGINIDEENLELAFSNNTVTNNDIPVKTHPNHLGALDATNSYTGNSNDFIFVNGYATGINRDLTWHKINVPYKLKADFTAGGGFYISEDVVVEAGVEIIMTANSSMRVRSTGSLAMNGESTDKILIRGEQNVAGYWTNITYASTNPLNKMSFLEIRNGGKTVTNPTLDPNGALLIDSSYLTINDVAFIRCFDFAINLRASTFTQSNLTYTETPREIGDWDNDPI
ncbi:hypothetical protein [Bizionia myxarmorum]|uniref:Right-handed parallel beta-helix repeat-containing protein n=1 Tax=Bizionia myxarmorum TaxID=291186 RepID=A0A5D0R5T0_9FLAO|nr:hypothetical protein [Bizionia myxarmorum]TYB75904.1 hypothetical protein ES674_13905 [Bizionia myxarmorum]